jgi:hypothetical protein
MIERWSVYRRSFKPRSKAYGATIGKYYCANRHESKGSQPVTTFELANSGLLEQNHF